jgi:hypothetical protein
MKPKTLPSAYENYESLKLNRIRNFNNRDIQKIMMYVFVLLVVIAIVLQISVSRSENIKKYQAPFTISEKTKLVQLYKI